MGYTFLDPCGHREALVKALHGARWSEDLPEHIDGLNANQLLETAVDEIRHLERELAQARERRVA